jgi:hypothetical protein
MTTQSQHQIESDLVALFPNGGYFVEIGCWDGELISQTAVLERAGWRGICVDPFPRNFEERSCKLIKKAVSRDGLPREFVSVSIDRRYGILFLWVQGYYWQECWHHGIDNRALRP